MATASTSNYRHLRGGNESVFLPTAASTAYQIGDLIWDNNGVAAVASTSTYTNLVASQAAFRQKFVGVCNTYKPATDTSTSPIEVVINGTWAYPCTALGSDQVNGAYVAPEKDTTSNLLDQKLAITAGYTASIGTLVGLHSAGATTLVVRLQGFENITKNSTSV